MDFITCKVTTEVIVPVNQIRDLLSTALEGGINYWAGYKPNYTASAKELLEYTDGIYQDMLVYAITHPEYSLGIRDTNTGKEFTVSLEDMKNAIHTMSKFSPRAFKLFIDEDYDAAIGDVFMQYCVFGRVVYG